MSLMMVAAAPAPPLDLPSGCGLGFPTGYVVAAPTVPWNHTRMYLWPGLGGSTAQWSSGEFLTIAQDLQAAGFELIYLNLPSNPQPCYFVNGGAQYREQFAAWIASTIATVNADRGAAAHNIAGGISYGGLHSMMAGAISGLFSAWWASVPVTRVDALSEFAGTGDARWFNPQFEIAPLYASNGWLSWGTSDTRVNFQLTIDIAAQLSSSVMRKGYDAGHDTPPQAITDLVAWAVARQAAF